MSGPSPYAGNHSFQTLDNALGLSLALARRDAVWLVPCTLALWLIGVILGLDDAGRVFRGHDPAAPTWAAWGIVLGVVGIWRWRRWLVRDDYTRPPHDPSDDALWLTGVIGALVIYILIVPSARLLPPNASLCVMSGLAGARLIYSGLTRRVGQTLHCSRCNYQIIDTSLPRRCPECAGVWAHRLVRGKVERSMPLFSVGIILVFVMTLAPIPRLEVSRAFIRRQMSTAWILSQAETALAEGRLFDNGLWIELAKRPLTENQAQHLADIVLAQSAAGKLRDFSAMQWLENLVFAGKAPRAAAEGFMNQALAFQVSVPGRIYEGSEMPIRIQALELQRFPRDRVAIFLESVTQDSDPNPLASAGKWELLSDATASQSSVLPQRAQSWSKTLAASANGPHSDVLGVVAAPFADPPGRKTIRASIWAAIVPSGAPPVLLPQTLADQYANAPTTGATPPVPWLKRYHLQAGVLVVEPSRKPTGK